jgi:hypothetical protein
MRPLSHRRLNSISHARATLGPRLVPQKQSVTRPKRRSQAYCSFHFGEASEPV